jgi:zinc resistance-associated protein
MLANKTNFLKEEQKMLGKVKIVMVGLALVAMAGVAVAGGPGYGFGRNANCAGYNQLNLTPEQKTKLSELQEKQWKESVTLRNEMQTKRLELRTLWTAPTPDKDKILAKQKEMNELRDRLQAKGTDFRLEARKVLTPEQAAQVGTFGPGMGMGGGMMGMGGRGMMMRQGPCGGPQGGGFGPGTGYGPGGARL